MQAVPEDPVRAVPEDPVRAVPEDLARAVPEDPARAVPEDPARAVLGPPEHLPQGQARQPQARADLADLRVRGSARALRLRPVAHLGVELAMPHKPRCRARILA